MNPNSSPPSPQLLTRQQTAARLAISVKLLDRLIHAGTLKAVRIGRAVRVRETDLARYVQALEGVS